jgi:hypothetical protein
MGIDPAWNNINLRNVLYSTVENLLHLGYIKKVYNMRNMQTPWD